MDRRTLLKGLFGAAVVAAGGTALTTGEAQAAVPRVPPAPSMEPVALPGVATEADLQNARVENVQWVRNCWWRGGVRVCGPWRPRRRVIVYRRPVYWRRRVWVRPVYYRRRVWVRRVYW